MRLTRIVLTTFIAGVCFLSTGCFRVSSDTSALRDAALDNTGTAADETFEFGVGFFTVALARIGAKFVELPPEAEIILGSVQGAECSIYELNRRTGDLSKILSAADRAMDKRGCDRLVGVVDDRQLVAIYVPRNADSPRKMKVSVLVLNDRQLVCATARADLEPLLDLALSKATLSGEFASPRM